MSDLEKLHFEYDELLKRYEALQLENNVLRNENSELHEALERYRKNGEVVMTKNVSAESTRDSKNDDGKIKECTTNEEYLQPFINRLSSTQEKISLFRSLFKGRDDVFAKRWHSKNTQKSGYQPVCKNEWVEGLCDKSQNKCSSCPNREFASLTDKDIFNHLAGKDPYARDVVGIYPMLTDESCTFLCIDFDGDNYLRDISAVKQVCKDLHIFAAIERSRSGNGAHLWVFFEESISAKIARTFGSSLLTKAMENCGLMSLSSYDRIFPNQDNMPDGGFGNLIALPLQGLARKSGNSVFVDENFNVYDDQWAYLNSIKKISVEQINDIVNNKKEESELGELVKSDEQKPWETKVKKSLTRFDFPSKIEIVHSNMLYVKIDGLSERAKNAIKRLGAFKNSEFYKAQAMRFPVYDKPRIICTSEIIDDYIALPRGCKKSLCELLTNASVDFGFIDMTNAGNAIAVQFNGELRENQIVAAEALLSRETGVLSAATAFGKTVVAANIISVRKRNTLILVHTRALLNQWKKSLESFLTFDNFLQDKKGCSLTSRSPIGVLCSGKNSLGGIVDIAVMQSLVSDGEVKYIVRGYGMVIIDECHHVPAINFELIMKYVNAKYVYGLSATPYRQDGKQPIIFMQCGEILYRYDAKEQIEKSDFEHFLIPEFTEYKDIAAKNKGVTTLYKELSTDKKRNEKIVADVVAAVKAGKTPIVLTERREHVKILVSMLENECIEIIKLVGSASAKERRETMDKLNEIPSDRSLIIVATGRFVGEGFDYPRLDTLFLALPISWKGKVAQYAGRLHRSYPGKKEVCIYDYIDIHIPVFEKMYQKRLKSYSSIGYKARTSINECRNDWSNDIIFDGKNYYVEFFNDIRRAEREIIIFSPKINEKRISELIKSFYTNLKSGVTVSIVLSEEIKKTESPDEKIESGTEKLKDFGINVFYKPDVKIKAAVFDQKTVWYGSVNFLGYSSHDDSVIRIENESIAGNIIDLLQE